MGILNKMPESKLNLYLKIPILSGIVKNKIKKSLGLSKARIILTGAASMPSSLLDWYKKLGIIIQEAYGMTENVGICTSMRIDNIKKGTVGQTYPGCELKIEPITKEVLMKADWVMNGYFKDEEKTNETVKDGWLHTGDMGEIDSSGFLKITGRVKDQFKGAKGEFIVPAPIENDFAANNYVEQVCLVGRGLPQPVALIVLSEDGQKDDRSTVKETLEETRKSINTSLVSHEKVQKIVIVNQPWGIENNMLTPTLKIKRNVLEEVYGQRLEDWYETKDSIIFE
jgi:long-subunit acyl-CoA synthetase (AMP-forming)